MDYMDELDTINGLLFGYTAQQSRRILDDNSSDSAESFNSSYAEHDLEFVINYPPLRSSSNYKNVEKKPRKMMKLLDIAASTVAKHCQTQEIEIMNPALDESLLKKVAYHAFPQDEDKIHTLSRMYLPSDTEWARGQAILKLDEIKEIRQVGFMLSAIIYKQNGSTSREDTKVSVTFEKQTITSSKCALCPGYVWCQHIIAVILYRIRNADMVPIHAPVTETLSTLTRDQLQKLLQYAINEDPGGILGRVFQYIDEIRDQKSSLNNVMGAPDPTFGVALDEVSTWEQTLDQMCRTMADDFRIGCQSYPETFDLIEKKQSKFSEQFIQRLFELLSKGDEVSAGQVLIKIGVCTMEAMKNRYYSPKFLLYDLEKLFSFFIMTCSGPVREDVINAVMDINRETSKYQNVVFYKPCEYVDIGSIKISSSDLDKLNSTTDHYKPDLTEAVPTAPFYQPLLASFLPGPPALKESTDECISLLSLSDKLSCEEPLPVMLLRFDCLVQWPWYGQANQQDPSRFDQLRNLGCEILKIVHHLSDNFSIMSLENECPPLEKECMPVEDHTDDGSSSSKKNLAEGSSSQDFEYCEISSTVQKPDNSTPLSPRRSTRKRKSSIIKAATIKNAKKQKKRKVVDLGVLTEGLSCAQMACILYYVSYSIVTAQHSSDNYHIPHYENNILSQAILRAIELGRASTKANKNVLPDTAYVKLHFMETGLKHFNPEPLKNCIPPLSIKSQEYMDMLLRAGLDFYGESIPFSLICFLLESSDIPDQKKVQLATMTICYSSTPLNDMLCNESFYYHSYPTEGMRSKEQVLRKWKDVLNVVCNSSTAFPSAMPKVMSHLKAMQDVDFLSMAIHVIQPHCKLLGKCQKEQFLCIILECICYAGKNPTWNGAVASFRGKQYETFCALAEELKYKFPKLILPAWKDLCSYFRSSHLLGLLEIIKNAVSEVPELASELSELLIGYFEGNFDHDEDCISLLSVTDGKPSVRQQAIKCILDNSENYSGRALLLLAKEEHESHGRSRSPNELFHRKVFQILMTALIRLRQVYSHPYMSFAKSIDLTYLEYFFQQFAEHGNAEVAKGNQFSSFVDALDENCDVEAVLSFCDKMQRCEPLYEKMKPCIGKHLGKKYYDQFDMRLRLCSHSDYNKVLFEMVSARKNFLDYIPNGEEEFKVMLFNIRKNHLKKKKLQKLIVEHFLPEIHDMENP